MRSASQVAFLILSCLVLSLVSWSQTATTSLRGTVTDAKGAVLPDATVTIQNSTTGFSRSAQANSEGEYQFLQIPPATYTVIANAKGFAQLREDNVQLQVSTPATLNLTMQVQGAAVTVEVTGVAPAVNTTDATIGNAFNSQQLIALPSEGRDPVAILSLQPGVTFIGNNVDPVHDSRGGAVGGARSDQTNVTLDGLDNNDQLNGFAFQGALRTTLDSLQEFRVTTSSANADAGRSSGAQVSLVTKSGTNNLHGSLYEYHRPTFTTANDWFNKQSELRAGEPNVPGHLVRNTFGAAIGGPIKKDKVFFFATYEGQRTRETEQVVRTVPSATLRQGMMLFPCNTNDDPNCFLGNSTANFNVTNDPRVGAGQLLVTLTPQGLTNLDPNCTASGTCPLGPGANPAVLSIFNQYPEPNSNAAGDLLDYSGFTFAGPHPFKHDTYIAKLDFKIDQAGKHSVFVRGNLQNDNESKPPQFPGQPPNDHVTDNSKGIAVGYAALLSNNVINNFRWALVRQGLGDSGLSSSDFNHFRGLTDVQGFTNSILTNVPVYNFVDDVSWTKGKHTIQFGGNWRLILNNRASNAQNVSEAFTNVFWLDNAGIAGSGSSLDPGAFTGYPAVDPGFGESYDFATAAVTGMLTEVNKVYNQDKTGQILAPGSLVPRHFKSNEYEFYVQDSWRIKPNLVLTGGLRYSLLQPPYETHGNQAAPSVSLHDWFNQRAAAMEQGQTFHQTITLNLSGQANGKEPYWNWDYKNFAPRLALAYSPNFDSGFLHSIFGGSGKSSIRAGWGIYYDHFGEGVVNTFDRQGSFGLTTTLVNPAGFQDVDCVARLTGLTTLPSGNFCGQNVVGPPPGNFPVTPPTGFNDGSFAIYWGLDDKLRTPYSQVFDFSITRELARNFTVQASYVGRLGTRLLQEADLAMPLNIRDPKSGTDYFAAATQLTKAANAGVDINNLAPIPYWENLFPAAAGNLGFGPPGDPNDLGCAPGDNVSANNYTATQAMYDMYSCFAANETTALFVADLFCLPACSAVTGGQPFAYFDDQFSSLYSWRSQGTSAYHGLQFTLRHPMSSGLQFDLNYTLSKSIDEGSNAERINVFETSTGGFGDQVINSWSPKQLRAVSDFDMRHQINLNWVWQLPVGPGKAVGSGMGRIANAILGGWDLSGLFHWTSGLPFGVFPGGGWPTNWELQGLSVKTGNPGAVGTFIDSNGDPNIFKNGAGAASAFRFPYPGESGTRNELRGPGFFGIDTGVGKSWKITEGQNVQFRWETFNATNSVRFDAAQSANFFDLTSTTNFGKYGFTLTKPRVMQFALRYEF